MCFKLCRIFSQGSQSCDASILSGELGASQSRSKSHLKPRLGWTRQMLTNKSPEDSGTEHTSVGERNATLISPTTSYPGTKARLSRKISYSEAMQQGHMFMEPLTEDKPHHLRANVTSISGQYPSRPVGSIASHARLHQSGLHRYSLDDRRNTAIIGKLDPTSYWSRAEYPYIIYKPPLYRLVTILVTSFVSIYFFSITDLLNSYFCGWVSVRIITKRLTRRPSVE